MILYHCQPDKANGAAIWQMQKFCHFSGFLQVRENWKKSGNLSSQGKSGEDIFWKSQGK